MVDVSNVFSTNIIGSHTNRNVCLVCKAQYLGVITGAPVFLSAGQSLEKITAMQQKEERTHVQLFVLYCTAIWHKTGLSWACSDFF